MTYIYYFIAQGRLGLPAGFVLHIVKGRLLSQVAFVVEEEVTHTSSLRTPCA